MSETELPKSYEPTEVESRWYPVWMQRGYFTADPLSTRPPFSIVLPPPNITGSLHLGHALTATIQDVLIRWKRMSGFNCLWLPGTDHAGIATQMVVEKELKKSEKKSRHDLGREEFLRRVWAWKEKYGERIGEQHKVLGASLDWTRERFTMDLGLSAAVREVFVRLFEEGLVYRAQKLINWCPSCLTALSDLEVENPERDGVMWHIAYPVKGAGRNLVVATTRPETMLGDTAVAVHPEDPRYKDLIGRSVELPLTGRDIPIIADAELVSMEFGTGAVKVTPGHDFNDYQTGLRHSLPIVSIFDERARANQAAGAAYAGLDRTEARKRVLEDLKARGLLLKEEPHRLAIGVCQRCSTVLEPRLSPQWFVKIEPLARVAIEAVEQGRTRFIPESWTQTYFAWMRNIRDWCISRQLWWGHQIPAYYCTRCTKRTEAGSLDLALGKPIVARERPAACPSCGGSLEQDPDVLDTWFSSGLWPFSTLGWPKQTPELEAFYPTSVMETGHDIIFFWVARMMMMGLHFMGEVPFRTVYLHAMVRDEKGEKMSKTKGNVIDPLDVVRGAKAEALPPALKKKFPQGMPAFGADALRFTLAALTQQGRDIKLSLDRVGGYKAFGNKLWNAARFALMNLGDFREAGRFVKERKLTLADRWILSRLDRAVAGTREALDSFQFSDAASTVYQFLWGEFCDWYIELSKASLYGDDPEAKESARAVLVFCLDRILRLLHPFMPFITEEIWQKLPMQRPVESIMVAEFPGPDSRLSDPEAEREMQPVISAIEGVRNIRGESNLPPQAKLEAHVQSPSAETRSTLEKWKGYLLPLAGLKAVHIGPPGAKPARAAAFVGGQMEIFVPLAGLIDLDEERSRLQKEISRAEADLLAVRAKLENPQFVSRAPAEVVQEARDRVVELEARKAKLNEHLRRISPEGPMPDPKRPQNGGAPKVASVVSTPETAEVKIAPPAEGSIDLSQELEGDLEGVRIPAAPDPQVAQALEKLREGTKQGLSPKDHYDLGVAYMEMGLVDDAVREFNAAKSGEKKAKRAKPARAKAKRTSSAKARAKVKASPKVKSSSRAKSSGPKKPARASVKARKARAKPARSRRARR
ncbi:MAG: valine--tRNA ligase [Myxococcales bacterium]|nr:valine--tRNA ligase [Myxococcales bacterium]